MTEADKMAGIGRVLARIYGHLSDAEIVDLHRGGFIPRFAYEYLRAVRGL